MEEGLLRLEPCASWGALVEPTAQDSDRHVSPVSALASRVGEIQGQLLWAASIRHLLSSSKLLPNYFEKGPVL